MVDDEKQPNTLLAGVMNEAGATNKGLARRVRLLSEAGGGEPVRCDHVSVKRWLEGTRPQPRTCLLIAHVLGELLGRKINLQEIGYADPGPADDGGSQADDVVTHGTEYPERTDTAVRLLDTLADRDLADAPSVTGAQWSSQVAPQVITGYMFAEPAPLIVAETFEPVRGMAVAERIRDTTASLMRMDFQWGGGYVRRMLLQFFRDQVVPELRKTHPDRARREIFSAAAEVAQLLGWSAYDAGRHGAAMRYFVQGLKLAREAQDYMMGGRLLANLSHQANFLGNFSDAVKFARAAQSATFGHTTKNVEAMYVMHEARALANLGDRQGTAGAVHRAEHLFGQRDPAREPGWIGYYDAEELAGDASHCFRDLGMVREAKEFVVQALGEETPPRTRAFIQMVSAAASHQAGDLDEAVALASEAVRNGAGLQSARYLRYLTDFQGALTAHTGHMLVGQFEDLLSEHYPDLPSPLRRRGSPRTDASAGQHGHSGSYESAAGTQPRYPATGQRSA